MIIQSIVEGQGEEAAFPVLLRRLRDECHAWGMDVARPHRRRRSQLVQKDHLQTAVAVAALTDNCGGIVILFDADDDCPRELAAQVKVWADEVSNGIPCAVIIANREYEAWFLGDIEHLRGKCGIRFDAPLHEQPETPRDAKGQLEERMVAGGSYAETVDQAQFSAAFDLRTTYRNCRSFRKLVTSLGTLMDSAGVAHEPCPPPHWNEGEV